MKDSTLHGTDADNTKAIAQFAINESYSKDIDGDGLLNLIGCCDSINTSSGDVPRCIDFERRTQYTFERIPHMR